MRASTLRLADTGAANARPVHRANQFQRVLAQQQGKCLLDDSAGALKITGDPWAEDPGCYLTDAEIGRAAPASRVTTTPFRGVRHEAPLAV